MSSAPRISIVIPVRNGQGLLAACLQALRRQTLDQQAFEVVVVDDGSTDATASTPLQGNERMVSQPPGGASAARNRGVLESRGEIVLFTDADCRPQADWAEKLSRPMLAGQAEGTVGRCLSRQRQWVAALIQIELDERYAEMGKRSKIDFLNTGNCGFLRPVLGEKPFDESFKRLEDVELSFRLASEGRTMIFIPDAGVHHPHPTSLRSHLSRKFRYASYAPLIYRRYPGKTFSDSRTPLSRRLQLLSLGIAGLAFPFAWLHAAGAWTLLAALLFSLGCAFPLLQRARRTSLGLAAAAPLFALLGNLAFILGSMRGVLRSPPAQSYPVESRPGPAVEEIK